MLVSNIKSRVSFFKTEARTGFFVLLYFYYYRHYSVFFNIYNGVAFAAVARLCAGAGIHNIHSVFI